MSFLGVIVINAGARILVHAVHRFIRSGFCDVSTWLRFGYSAGLVSGFEYLISLISAPQARVAWITVGRIPLRSRIRDNP